MPSPLRLLQRISLNFSIDHQYHRFQVSAVRDTARNRDTEWLLDQLIFRAAFIGFIGTDAINGLRKSHFTKWFAPKPPVHGEFVILHRDRHLEQTAAMVPPSVAGKDSMGGRRLAGTLISAKIYEFAMHAVSMALRPPPHSCLHALSNSVRNASSQKCQGSADLNVDVTAPKGTSVGLGARGLFR